MVLQFWVDPSISEKEKQLPSLIPRILQAKSPRDESVHASKGKSQTRLCYSAVIMQYIFLLVGKFKTERSQSNFLQ